MKKIPIDKDAAERAASALSYRIDQVERDVGDDPRLGPTIRRLLSEGIVNDRKALEHINASIKAEDYNGPG